MIEEISRTNILFYDDDMITFRKMFQIGQWRNKIIRAFDLPFFHLNCFDSLTPGGRRMPEFGENSLAFTQPSTFKLGKIH